MKNKINQMKGALLLLFMVFVQQVIVAQIDKETNFYQDVKNKGLIKNMVKDYGLKSNFDPSSSGVLQKAVDEISSKGGGTLNIPKGNYLLSSTSMKSNVHIVIDKDAVIRLKVEGKNNALFSFGEKNMATIKNVSIVCSDKNKRYIVDFEHSGDEPAFAQMGNVENFLIAGFEVKDNFTKFSSIRMGISEYNGDYFYPTNGIIKNCATINSHYGYGLVQSQASKNVLFKDLSGVGGATLRLETGAKKVNDLQKGGNFGVVARNISCKNGNSSLMVSPHAMQNGTVDIDGVYGENCGFVLRIEKGYIATKYNDDPTIKAGSYESVTAKNIKGVYGVEAQLKSKHFKFMPCALHSAIKQSPENENRSELGDVPIYTGPAIAVVVDTDQFPTFISNVEAIGFITKPIVTDNDEFNCGDEKKYEVKKGGTKKVKGEKKEKVGKIKKVKKEIK